MTVEDYRFGLDESNIESVEFIEDPTKTRQSGLSANPRSFLSKMFATGDDMCPVAIFKEFLCHSPPELGTTGPLYLSCVKDPTSQVWYKRQPMGVNKINQMMEPIIKDTSLEEHSVGKTVVNKLKTAGVKRSSIVKLTGHRNLQCLDDYDEGDENKQRQLYHTISSVSTANQLSETNIGSPSTLNPFSFFAAGARLGRPKVFLSRCPVFPGKTSSAKAS